MFFLAACVFVSHGICVTQKFCGSTPKTSRTAFFSPILNVIDDLVPLYREVDYS